MTTSALPGALAIESAASDFLLAAQARPSGVVWAPGEFETGVCLTVVGCAVAVAIFRLVPRLPWPRPFRLRFVAAHILAAPVVTGVWVAVSLSLAWMLGVWGSDMTLAEQVQQMMVVGCFFYVVIAGLSYSAHGAERAAHAEAVAAQTQLATLRSQLQPHFLFNALHTVVQLIHIDPSRAANAAELVAELLRRALEEQRDEVPLGDEWSFVFRYLAVEQIRFGERLVVNTDLPPTLHAEHLPSFALQTLVENAVQHGVAPRVEPTQIDIHAIGDDARLVITVRNNGDVPALHQEAHSAGAVSIGGKGTGTGLARLRERLSVLYSGRATLVTQPVASGGYEAVLTIPRDRWRRA